MTIKIGIFGLGKAGKIVAQSLQEDEQFDLLFAVNNKVKNNDEFDFTVKPKEHIEALLEHYKPDIILDFTSPEAVINNIDKLQKGTGYIVVTTGFTETQLQILKAYEHLKLLYAITISDGINIVMKLCEAVNQVWNHADVDIIEQHFKEKKDSPSGTAQELAKLFSSPPTIHSVRSGETVGIHEVILATADQKITIKHESFNKKVFAEGAKKAALWLADKPNGFYNVSEMYK